MNWTAFAAVVSAVLAFAGVLYGGVITVRTSSRAQKASPYEALAKRVVDLESADAAKGRTLDEQEQKLRELANQLEEVKRSDAKKGREIVHLRGEVAVLAEHADLVHAWIDAGSPPPPPAMPDAVAQLVQRLREQRYPGSDPSQA